MKDNIIPHQHHISKEDRCNRNGYRSVLLWFTGLSGSGKSTLASNLERRLFEEGRGTYILDGDNIRSGLNSDLDFSNASRQENIRRIGEVSKLFIDAGIITLTAFISPFRSDRHMVRELVGNDNFLEIFVSCPIEECEKRDVKGLYAKARRGEIKNFTGIDSPFEEPVDPDITIKTNEVSIDEGVERLYQLLKEKIKN